jgi:hypothetical protein
MFCVDPRVDRPLSKVKCPEQAVARVEGKHMKGRGPKEVGIEVEADRWNWLVPSNATIIREHC